MAASAKDDKPDAAPVFITEREKVRRHRRKFALKLGLTFADAELFAATLDVSLTQLRHVIVELKASPEQAARALL